MDSAPSPVRPAAHAVVAGAVGPAHDKRQFGHLSARHGVHKLSAVLGDATGLGVTPHHKTGDVLEEEQGNPSLAAEFDEVRSLERGLGEEDAVVAHNTQGEAVQPGKA